MGALDIFEGMGGDVGSTLIPIVLIGAVLAVIVFGGYFMGLFDGLLKRYQTIALCYEKRRGQLVFVGQDRLNAETIGGKLTYHFKTRKHLRINVPNLNFLDLVLGKSIVHMYIAGRLEAHPIDICVFTAKSFKDEAYSNYEKIFTRKPETLEEAKEAFALIDIQGEYLKRVLKDKEAENFEEFNKFVEERDRHDLVQFLPTVNESHLNLLAEQISSDKNTYATKWEKFKELLPILGPVIFVFAFGIGLFLTFGKIDELIVHLDSFVTGAIESTGSVASGVAKTLPVEMP